MKLFIYGTLINPTVQQAVIGRRAQLAPAIARNFDIGSIIIKGKIYPIAVPAKGLQVEGYVIEITPQELLAIDEYETNAYQRQRTKLKAGPTVWIYAQPSSSQTHKRSQVVQ